MAADESSPRPSSTVVLARDGDKAPDIFMVKRHRKSSFGSRFAFPGGVLEPSDARVHAFGKGLPAARTALNSGELAWDQFAADNKLVLQYDQLHYFSYWITPVGLPKRYAARFFLAQAPTEQVATHDGAELTSSCWLPAAEVLQARKDKQMKLPYPTRKTLKRVAQFDSLPELLRWAQACGEKGVVCDQPAFPREAVL